MVTPQEARSGVKKKKKKNPLVAARGDPKKVTVKIHMYLVKYVISTSTISMDSVLQIRLWIHKKGCRIKDPESGSEYGAVLKSRSSENYFPRNYLQI